MFISINTYLSAHFSLADAIKSNTATADNIDNTPSPAIISVMTEAASKLEVVRSVLGNLPIDVNSWYRCTELNRAVGGVPNSQHILGEAIDFVCPKFGTCADIAHKLLANIDLIGFDQLILEHTWVHISFAITSRIPRKQVLSLLANGKYSVGLTDKEGNIL